MANAKTGVLATVSVLAVTATGHAAVFGHLLPVFSKDARTAATEIRPHRDLEIPEWQKKLAEETAKHCAREAEAGENCLPR